MTIAAIARPRQVDVRQLLLRRPELGAAAVVAVAWAALLVLDAHDAHGGSTMPDMAGRPSAGHVWSDVASGLPYWVLMSIAMMGPAALAGVRHTGVNSLGWRRRRAMAEFATTYLAVWIVFGVVVLAADGLSGMHGSAALAIALAAAAIWQLSPLKRRWLRDCHRSVPLPPSGWVADRGALRFGLRNGRACLGSCWCLMCVMTVAPGAHIAWAIALAGFSTTERLLQRPGRATRWGAATLIVAAVGAALA